MPQHYEYVKAAYFYARHNLVTILKRLPVGEKAIVFVELGDDLAEMETIFGDTAAYYCSPFNERYRKKYSDLSVCVKDGRQLKDILFTTKAMGVGIGLKDRGVKHIFIDQWNPLEIAQSIGRKRSLDADDTCTVYFRDYSLDWYWGTNSGLKKFRSMLLNKYLPAQAYMAGEEEFDKYLHSDNPEAIQKKIDKSKILEHNVVTGYHINPLGLQQVEHDIEITDLDEIPYAAEFIKRRLCVTDYVFPAAAFPSIQIFTGRGCPAQCNFCVYPQTLHGHRYRLRSPENVIGEIEYIVNNFPDVKEIVFEDDTFTINKQRVSEICNMMIQKGINKKIRWLCNARVNLDYETMCLMKKAGCHLIIPGIESVNQQILKNIHKGTTVEQIEAYVANARKAGLMIHACYMVGNQGETHETMKETLAAAMRFKTDTAQFFPLIPYPGTGAYNWAKSNGYINGKYDEYIHEDGTLNCIINTPELSAQELVDFCAYARKKYYMRPWYIGHRLARGLRDPEDLKRSLKAFWRLKDSLLK